MHTWHAGGLPKGGGSHSGVARFFLFLLVAGIATIGFGVWWSQVTEMLESLKAALGAMRSNLKPVCEYASGGIILRHMLAAEEMAMLCAVCRRRCEGKD